MMVFKERMQDSLEFELVPPLCNTNTSFSSVLQSLLAKSRALHIQAGFNSRTESPGKKPEMS